MPSRNDADERARDYIQSLSDKQFAEFFYEVAADRSTSDIQAWRGHYVLADCEQVEGESWSVDLIALGDEGQSWAADVPLCQSGMCMNCDARVRSWVKHARCPVCGEAVYCT